jgi:hypothetical protein
MPPFKLDVERRFFGIYTKEGKYCCSIALYPFKDDYLIIQGASIDAESPYYAFSCLIYRCLELSLRENFKGIDLAGPGTWKQKWQPKDFDNSHLAPRSLTGGRISKILAKIYWSFK